LWWEADATKAVEEAINGAKIVNLVTKYGIPDKTFVIERHKNGDKKRKPGPAPILAREQKTTYMLGLLPCKDKVFLCHVMWLLQRQMLFIMRCTGTYVLLVLLVEDGVIVFSVVTHS
jgi:hypothetical protein